jgi:hypothetical protein
VVTTTTSRRSSPSWSANHLRWRTSRSSTRPELDLDRENTPSASTHDQIDLVLALLVLHVHNGRLGCLGEDPNAKDDQRLEQVAEQDAIAWDPIVDVPSRQQCLGVDLQEPRR